MTRTRRLAHLSERHAKGVERPATTFRGCGFVSSAGRRSSLFSRSSDNQLYRPWQHDADAAVLDQATRSSCSSGANHLTPLRQIGSRGCHPSRRSVSSADTRGHSIQPFPRLLSPGQSSGRVTFMRWPTLCARLDCAPTIRMEIRASVNLQRRSSLASAVADSILIDALPMHFVSP